MRSLRYPLLGLVLVALALTIGTSGLLAGCSTGDDGSLKTYTNPTYGFSFYFPADWQVVSSGDSEMASGAEPVAEILVGDPEGTQAGGTGVDLMTVRLYELNAVIDESLLPVVLTELESLVADMRTQDSSMEIEQPLTQTSVNGLPGYQFTWTFDWDADTPIKTTSYYLFAGELEYELVVQSSAENWDKNHEVFATFLATFQPGGDTD